MEGRPGSPPRSGWVLFSGGARPPHPRDPHVHSVVDSDGGAVAGRLAPQNVVPVCLLFDAESLSSAGAFPQNMDSAAAVLRGGLRLSACHRNSMDDDRTGGGWPDLGNGCAASPEGL